MAELFGAKEKFETLDGDRSSTLDRAVQCAEYTVPYLFREDSATQSDDLVREYVQGFGAKLVNHLVGKFALAVLPPSQPFYRLVPSPEAMATITDGDGKKKTEVEKIMSQKEDEVLRYINKSKFRKSLYPALKLAMVTGDALIEKNEDDTFRVFNMRSYVIKRDYAGRIVLLILKEMLKNDTLPEDLREADDPESDEEIELFTVVQMVDGKYMMHQEMDGEVVGEEDEFEKITDRFISVRWNVVDGEDYGRGLVEEYLGTFTDLNVQMKVLTKSAVVGSKTVFMLNPNGITKYKDYKEASNGDIIIGKEGDISVPQVNKNFDLVATRELVSELKKELAEAFLMGSAAIRDAERVTAHEVQLVASELESAFGGIYTSIAEDIQMPLVQTAIDSVDSDLDTDDVEIVIVTGVEALGRNVELQKIRGMIAELGNLAQLVGLEEVADSVNVSNISAAIVNNSGVAGKEFLYTEEQKTERVNARKTEQLAQQAALQGAGEIGKQAVQG